MDDPYVTCPYDQAHRVTRSRLQRHLVKCERHYPPLAICPYNATHRLPHKDMPAHYQICSSKEEMFPTKMNEKKIVKPPQHRDLDKEYWDD